MISHGELAIPNPLTIGQRIEIVRAGSAMLESRLSGTSSS